MVLALLLTASCANWSQYRDSDGAPISDMLGMSRRGGALGVGSPSKRDYIPIRCHGRRYFIVNYTGDGAQLENDVPDLPALCGRIHQFGE